MLPPASLSKTVPLVTVTVNCVSGPTISREPQLRYESPDVSGNSTAVPSPVTFALVTVSAPEVVEVREVMDAVEYDAFAGAAKAAGTSTIGLAMSALTDVTRRLADAPLRAVFPVHSRHEPRWHDSSGWFITNSVLECDDAAPTACAANW